MQVGLVLRDTCLRNFVLIKLENIHQFSNLCNNFQFNWIWHRCYAAIFGLMQFGVDDLLLHLSSVEGQRKMMSLSHHLSHVWIDYIGDIIMWLM